MMTDSKPKSRLPRTGALVLIALVLLIGSGVLSVWESYYRNQTAIAAIKDLEGTVESQFVYPAWFPEALKTKHWAAFERVTSVDLTITPISDADLGQLQGLAELEYLSLDYNEIGDAGMEHLYGLTNLEYLSLDSTQVSDMGIEHFAGFTQLKTLWIKNTQVTKTGVEKLQNALPNCAIFWIPPAE